MLYVAYFFNPKQIFFETRINKKKNKLESLQEVYEINSQLKATGEYSCVEDVMDLGKKEYFFSEIERMSSTEEKSQDDKKEEFILARPLEENENRESIAISLMNLNRELYLELFGDEQIASGQEFQMLDTTKIPITGKLFKGFIYPSENALGKLQRLIKNSILALGTK